MFPHFTSLGLGFCFNITHFQGKPHLECYYLSFCSFEFHYFWICNLILYCLNDVTKTGRVALVAWCGPIHAFCSSWNWESLLLACTKEGINRSHPLIQSFNFFIVFISVLCVLTLFYLQMIYSKNDEVGIVLFGAEGTHSLWFLLCNESCWFGAFMCIWFFVMWLPSMLALKMVTFCNAEIGSKNWEIIESSLNFFFLLVVFNLIVNRIFSLLTTLRFYIFMG